MCNYDYMMMKLFVLEDDSRELQIKLYLSLNFNHEQLSVIKTSTF